MKILQPVKDSPSDWDAMEKEIRQLFYREIYRPIIEVMTENNLRTTNSIDDLISAIRSGRIQYDDDRFTGKFESKTSRELRRLGARWDKSTESFHLRLSEMAPDLRVAIAGSEGRFKSVLQSIIEQLQQIFPEKIAERFDGQKLFDTSLWRLDEKISGSIREVSIAPRLTKEGRAEIAKDYTTNMRLYIQDFAQKEIENLRTQVREQAFSGNRYEALASMIQRSYEVSSNKAKFLARQETSILMAKFKKARYTEAGVNEYIWGCVRMPHDQSPEPHVRGNVRYSHGQLEGKVFRFDSPPITTNPGEPTRRNNPGEDYNCRCFARPVVRFIDKPKKAVVVIE